MRRHFLAPPDDIHRRLRLIALCRARVSSAKERFVLRQKPVRQVDHRPDDDDAGRCHQSSHPSFHAGGSPWRGRGPEHLLTLAQSALFSGSAVSFTAFIFRRFKAAEALRAVLHGECDPTRAGDALRIKHVVAEFGWSEKTARRWAKEMELKRGGVLFVRRDALQRGCG